MNGMIGDQFFGHTIAEILLIGIARVVDKRHYGNRRLANNRRGLERISRGKRAQIAQELRRTLIAGCRLAGCCARNDAIQLGILPANLRKPVVDDRDQNDGGIRSIERPLAGSHFVQEHAKREDVSSRVDRLRHQLLGRHIRQRANEQSFARLLGGAVARVPGLERLCQTEVEHLHAPVPGDHHVRRFQIAMDDSPRVRCDERSGDRNRERQNVAERHAPSGDDARQWRSLDQLHREKRNPSASSTEWIVTMLG
jgi:hypothetical protein